MSSGDGRNSEAQPPGQRAGRAGGLDWSKDGRDWPNREASRFVDAGGLRWHVQVAGRGPGLLLVHGTGASTHSWRGLLPLLAQDFTVVAPDLPGHAFTETPPATGMTLPAMAAGLRALLHSLGIEPRVVVGHSAGAAILARMCLDHMIEPAGLVSINGAMLPIGGLAGQVFSPLARVLASSSIAPNLFSLWASDRRVVARFIKQTGSRLDQRGLSDYARLARDSSHTAGALSMMANWDLDALERQLPSLVTPLVLVVGGRDGTISPNDARRIRGMLPSATLRMVRDLGHLAHEEDPAGTAAIIREAAATWGVVATA